MAVERVGRTAFGATFVKSMEAFVPEGQRLFEDPISLRMLPAGARFMVETSVLRRVLLALSEWQFPGTYGGMVCRTRAIDDAVRDAVAGGIRDVVILGAGLDTRAYRMPELEHANVLELDLPAMIAFKQERVRAQLGAPPPHLRYVSVDLDAEALDAALSRSGLAAGVPAFFVWEGVTQYLQPTAVDAALAQIGRRPRGSGVVFTYAVKAAGDGRSALGASIARTMARRGTPWRTCFDPATLAAHLRALGVVLEDDAGAAEYQRRYLAPLRRRLEVFDVERVARATVATS